ncbi:hypothetical protein [Paenibacillus gorillae]|uniref:hypothetical protein n=1 Tax=Paenibacillus gorillae TaxID=1243662 RepID=UPI0004B67A42|nr:hypothetical protein [Paenibacillus gorillae]
MGMKKWGLLGSTLLITALLMNACSSGGNNNPAKQPEGGKRQRYSNGGYEPAWQV